MSRKEVLSVIRGGYRTYLMDSGFQKPVIDEDITFRHSKFPDREIRIFTAPMMRGQLNYVLVWPSCLHPGIFQFRPDEGFYSDYAMGWGDYRDDTDLVALFDYAKQVHDSWLNSFFFSDDISGLAERIMTIRRIRVETHESSNNTEKEEASRRSLRESGEQPDYIQNFSKTQWADDLLHKLCTDGKLHWRVSDYWIEGDLIRGPKYDRLCRVLQNSIYVGDFRTEYYLIEGTFGHVNGRKVQYFEESGRVWGPPGDPPWIVQYDEATEI